MAKKSKKEIRILFTSVGRRVELVQAFKNAAEELLLSVKVYGADLSDTAPALCFCDVQMRVCRISDENYIPLLLRICEENEIDLLIPTIDTDLLLLAQHKNSFGEIGTKVFISSPEMVSYCRDKRRTAELFKRCGLLAPESFGEVENYNLGYPAFIKPLDGSSSVDAYKVSDKQELQEYAGRIANYVIQPFVEGTEYTVDIMCDFEGNPLFITPRERIAVRGGEVLKTKIVQDEQIIEESKQLIDVFKPCGPITVQLIRTTDKKDYFIEINPRFGGGAPLSMKAGADAAKVAIKLLAGEAVEYVETAARDGAVYSRFDQSICIGTQKAYKANKVTDLKDIYMGYAAVVFDLDDTLYSEKEYVKSGYRKVAVEVLKDVDAYERLWKAFEEGKPAIDTVLLETEIYSEELKAECLKVYRDQLPDIHLYEGVKEMLEDLRKAGKKTGIITDGRVVGQTNKIEKLGLHELVDEIIVTDELAGHGNAKLFRKPNNIAFEIMQRRLNVRFEEMIYVGDNLAKDFVAPQKLGMAYAYVDNIEGIYRGN
ncbi:MAG: HAD-IA family hydrolase [Lachnospiraceae bacterium]